MSIYEKRASNRLAEDGVENSGVYVLTDQVYANEKSEEDAGNINGGKVVGHGCLIRLAHGKPGKDLQENKNQAPYKENCEKQAVAEAAFNGNASY